MDDDNLSPADIPETRAATYLLSEERDRMPAVLAILLVTSLTLWLSVVATLGSLL